MRMNYLIYFFMFLVGFANAFNLSDTYNMALKYNADYLMNIAKSVSEQEKTRQGISSLLPNLNVSATVSENYLNISNAFYYHQPAFGVQLQQTVVDFGKFSEYKKSKYYSELSDLQLEEARQNLILDIASAYFNVLSASDLYTVIVNKKEAFFRQYQKALKSFDAGVVSLIDVNDAKASLDAAVAEEIQAKNDLINNKNIFNNLTGLNPNLIQPLKQDIDLIYLAPESVNVWVELAKQQNIKIKIAKIQTKMNLQDITTAKADRMPTVNLVSNYQYQGEPVIDSNKVTNTNNVPGSSLSSFGVLYIGLQLNIPLYMGGGINSQIRKSIASYEATMQTQTTVLRDIVQKTENAFWIVQNGKSIIDAQTQSLTFAKLKLNSDQISYEIGDRNSIDLINSEKNYADSIQNYNSARYQYLLSRIKLMYMVGKLNVDFLNLINNNIAQ